MGIFTIDLLARYFVRKIIVSKCHPNCLAYKISFFSTMARWNTGKCKSFNVNGSLKALDDNIMVTAETLNGRTFSYFWTSCKDAHRGEKREIMTSSDLIQAMCIIDSTAADPIMALLSYDKLLICYGETKTTHKMPPVPFFATSIFCCNYKLYTGKFGFFFADLFDFNYLCFIIRYVYLHLGRYPNFIHAIAQRGCTFYGRQSSQRHVLVGACKCSFGKMASHSLVR